MNIRATLISYKGSSKLTKTLPQANAKKIITKGYKNAARDKFREKKQPLEHIVDLMVVQWNTHVSHPVPDTLHVFVMG